MKEAAARGTHDLVYLDQCGFAPTLPSNCTWAREGTRPLLRYEAPQGRRVNVLGAYAPFGPQRRFVCASRLASEGKLDSTAFLDFVCRDVAGLAGGAAALDMRPPRRRRACPCTIVLDNYGVHHSKVVKAALPKLAARGITFYYLPAYSPKLNLIEPQWQVLKYHRLQDRAFTTGPTLQAAVDAALAQRATELHAPTTHLLEAA